MLYEMLYGTTPFKGVEQKGNLLQDSSEGAGAGGRSDAVKGPDSKAPGKGPKAENNTGGHQGHDFLQRDRVGHGGGNRTATIHS
ncbi:hypothetical protein CK203_042538 [Vitis vinifera]|uniref:Uncharacterized protein n=1 Tax=Vitis vinifera TaxID=29760 RepID=A0A438I7S1_VITVI|nr:hypothetical protein CK203_042538 [Vitis vinifera]